MTSAVDKNCTFLIASEKTSQVQQEDICKDLESNDIQIKIKGLKNAIFSLLSNENMPRVLMTVIRFCVTQDDHQLKKLMMLYWEIVPKYGADGKLLPEMILVCNALRNDLISPNEYIRGCMLRFLCKIREFELLEPLIPSIKQCLEHRHSYVRRNAALAVYYIHKTFGENLLPDGPELMEKFISAESDSAARRNAFLFLFNEAETIAMDFLVQNSDKLQSFGDGFALLVLELARKVCRKDPNQKALFIRSLSEMLKSESQAVSYEAAWTLVSLSTAPTAVRYSAQAYTTLLNTSSDNNVKLIILDRLAEMKKHHSKVVQEQLMDILRVLSSPNIHICKKALDVAIDLVGPRNIEEVIGLLKREVVKTQENEMEQGQEYKHLLINAIHRCAMKFAEVADSVVLVLLDFVAGEAGYNIMQVTKSIVEQYPHFRSPILRKVIDNLDEVTHADALRVALWMLGEYADCSDPTTKESMLLDAFETIRGLAGDPPFTSLVDHHTDSSSGEDKKGETAIITHTVTKNIVLSDGTYASVTSTETVGGVDQEAAKMPHLRRLICTGDILLGTVTALTLTKIALKTSSSHSALTESNRVVMGALLTAAGVGKLAEVKRQGRVGVYADCLERLSLAVRVLLDPTLREKLQSLFTEACREAYSALAAKQKAAKNKANELAKRGKASSPEDLIQFRQLRAMTVQGGLEVDLMDADDISRAVGKDYADGKEGGSGSGLGYGDDGKLRHIYQLTGYADPIYAEASLTVHEYDIIVDMLVINRGAHVLTNVTVELATIGDLKILERPQAFSLGPNVERRLRTNIKVSSTETGHIFGTIVFDNASSAQKTVVNLADIQLDIMDYIRPAECRSEEFRDMWAEFEWENKVAVNSNITDLTEYLNHIVNSTNMTCLTPMEDHSQQSDSNFLAANLYAKSVFGEDALVNVSVEKKEDQDGKLSGYIRIRSKTQGIALSLGDRITAVQRTSNKLQPSPSNTNSKAAETNSAGKSASAAVTTEENDDEEEEMP
jgi:coatomer subunit beta